MRFSQRAETQCRLSITVHTTAPNATTIDNLQPPEGKPENETIGKPILCRNSCMQLFSHECCGLSMPFGKLTLTKCTLGLLGLGALCILRPQNGSMILYNRKKVKYRKDGYCWKKRKDGKTTREDHMKLKVQGVEVLEQQCWETGHQSTYKGAEIKPKPAPELSIISHSCPLDTKHTLKHSLNPSTHSVCSDKELSHLPASTRVPGYLVMVAVAMGAVVTATESIIAAVR
ncbi:Calmodulin-binding transcription activator 1 [Anabarilius grahami]|uniref:Calmodulin-binding transcription activator 1 n=1 Tax=Anabarilius grahami TaxID=495550 RepID=A0A3N0XG78_ANAGA|nr:Calmodulin-binding transcription activator 1 [Anabarilius grahami]